MSVIKSWDTNLRYSEKKTLRNFLGLYLFLCLCILALLGVTYYNAQKSDMLQRASKRLNAYASVQTKALRLLHVNLNKTKVYPRNSEFKSAIYDSSKRKIFSLFDEEAEFGDIIYEKNGKIFYVRELESYYLGAKYLILQIKDGKKWLHKIYSSFLWIGLPLVFIFLIFGYFLSRLFLRPMKDAIGLLDRFIKDTTHELNTPISTILSNIETINLNELNNKNQTKLRRINIAALTVSNLYQDLVYLTLGHRVISKIEDIDLKVLFEERLEYFSLLMKSKNIILTQELTSANVLVDKVKLTRLVDNLISNAIKYNQKNGKLHVRLEKDFFTISNDGKTIKHDNMMLMFERYTRGDSEVGGFGIGLHIVWAIAKEYDFNIDVSKKSEKGGTCIKISW